MRRIATLHVPGQVIGSAGEPRNPLGDELAQEGLLAPPVRWRRPAKQPVLAARS